MLNHSLVFRTWNLLERCRLLGRRFVGDARRSSLPALPQRIRFSVARKVLSRLLQMVRAADVCGLMRYAAVYCNPSTCTQAVASSGLAETDAGRGESLAASRLGSSSAFSAAVARVACWVVVMRVVVCRSIRKTASISCLSSHPPTRSRTPPTTSACPREPSF